MSQSNLNSPSCPTNQPVQVVWFKRDLRVRDHAPLHQAARLGPVCPLYVVEPELWAQPDASLRHQLFITDSLVDLNQQLLRLGQSLLIEHGDAVEVFESLYQRWGQIEIHAHEETGNGWTFQRDQAVRRWAKMRGILIHEYPQFGVVRGLTNRDHWTRAWNQWMQGEIWTTPSALVGPQFMPEGQSIQRAFVSAPAFDQTPAPDRQRGGSAMGQSILEGFLNERGIRYRGGISSPNKAPKSASRLSAHIAYGTLSLREIVRATHQRQRLAKDEGQVRWRQSLAQFEKRLHWHCHFIQKLEQQPRIEFENMHRGFDGMRENEFDSAWFTAWAEGRTGYPLIDACMRSLIHTGWLTFRMRAMVTSFASYHLWLHWREPALHLARLFTDYEPGIHYNQIQMQSGTTGINATRIYNPVKQAQDQDPEGVFVRRWIPELNTPDYPDPIVDHIEASRLAKSKMKVFREQAGFRDEARAVYQALGSRRRPTRKKKKWVDKRQASLFD